MAGSRTETAKRLRRQLSKDADFLCSLNVMDYSLLLGVQRRRFEVVSRLA
jgi:hypothetical protein